MNLLCMYFIIILCACSCDLHIFLVVVSQVPVSLVYSAPAHRFPNTYQDVLSCYTILIPTHARGPDSYKCSLVYSLMITLPILAAGLVLIPIISNSNLATRLGSFLGCYYTNSIPVGSFFEAGSLLYSLLAFPEQNVVAVTMEAYYRNDIQHLSWGGDLAVDLLLRGIPVDHNYMHVIMKCLQSRFMHKLKTVLHVLFLCHDTQVQCRAPVDPGMMGSLLSLISWLWPHWVLLHRMSYNQLQETPMQHNHAWKVSCHASTVIQLKYTFAHFSNCGRGSTRSTRITSYGNPVYVFEVTKVSNTVHCVENGDSHANSTVSVQLLWVPAWKVYDDSCTMYMCGCLVNGVCMYGLAIVQAFGAIYMCTSFKTEQYHISNTV